MLAHQIVEFRFTQIPTICGAAANEVMAMPAIKLREPSSRKDRDSEAAIPILFPRETKPRAHFDEINVQTLVSSTVFA